MENYQITINDELDLAELSPQAEKEMIGTIHWLNRSEPEESFIFTGVWKHIPEDKSNNVFYFRYENNEMMFYVLEGEDEYSKTLSISLGDKLSFPKDSEYTWKDASFSKAFIQTDPSQKHYYPDSLLFQTLIKQLDDHKTEIKRPVNHHRIS